MGTDHVFLVRRLMAPWRSGSFGVKFNLDAFVTTSLTCIFGTLRTVTSLVVIDITEGLVMS